MQSSMHRFIVITASAALITLCLLLGACHHPAEHGGNYSWSSGDYSSNYRHRPVYNVNNSAAAPSAAMVVQGQPKTPSRQDVRQDASGPERTVDKSGKERKRG